MEREKIKKIVEKHRHEKAALLAILHEIQEEDRELGVESLRYVSELLKEPFAHIYGLATFYDAFSTTRKGEIEIRVCDGIACHIRGGDFVKEALESHLKINIGETSWDDQVSLGKVQCLGLCSIGPNISLNGEAHSKLTRKSVVKLLKSKLEGGK